MVLTRRRSRGLVAEDQEPASSQCDPVPSLKQNSTLKRRPRPPLESIHNKNSIIGISNNGINSTKINNNSFNLGSICDEHPPTTSLSNTLLLNKNKKQKKSTLDSSIAVYVESPFRKSTVAAMIERSHAASNTSVSVIPSAAVIIECFYKLREKAVIKIQRVFRRKLRWQRINDHMSSPGSPNYSFLYCDTLELVLKKLSYKELYVNRGVSKFFRDTIDSRRLVDDKIPYDIDACRYMIRRANMRGSLGDIFTLHHNLHLNWLMRLKLVEWLIEVQVDMTLAEETLALAVIYTDTFLSSHSLPRTKIQLLGITSLLVASKLNDTNPPSVTEMSNMCDGAYGVEELAEFEKKLIISLKYELNPPTAVFFLQYYIHIFRKTSDEFSFKCWSHYAMYLLEATYSMYHVYSHHLPQYLAAGCFVASVNKYFPIVSPAWTVNLAHITSIDANDSLLTAAIKDIVLLPYLFHYVADSHQSYLKYSKRQYMRVSLSCPSHEFKKKLELSAMSDSDNDDMDQDDSINDD